jgi:hypothetical protein
MSQSTGTIDRAQAWLEALSRGLIRHAAQRAPPDLSDRLAEEWQADCGVRPTALSQLGFALGCCWATRVIAREHCPAMTPVAASVMVSSSASSQIHKESDLLAPRSSMFFLVAGLHIALFYGLMTGLAFRIAEVKPISFRHAVSQTTTGPIENGGDSTTDLADPLFHQEVLRWP